MKKFLKFVLLSILLVACTQEPSTNAIETAIAETQAVVPTITNTPFPTITFTPTITNTPKPTNTPIATRTPRPTYTPKPTATKTPIPDPILLSGSGDAVVDLDKWNGPALIHVVYSGSSNFVVWNFDSQGEKIDLLVNTIGTYDGTRPLDFLNNEETARLQIESSGAWEITVLPLVEMRRVKIPGTFEGTGDDVVYLDGDNPDLLIVDASMAKSNFVIWGYSNKRDLLVNEIAPYTGTVIAGNSTIILVIEATGSWSIEVTTR